MDKKIILSIVIVALIGIVAATYQININDNLLNPLASIEQEDSPVTDALAAPASTGDSSNSLGNGPQNAQQQTGQQATDASQQAGQNSQNNKDNQEGTQNSATSGSALISSDSPILVTESSNSQASGQNQNNGGQSNPNSNNNPSNNPNNNPNPTPTPSPTPNPSPSPSPTPSPSPDTTITIKQALTHVLKNIDSSITIDESSVRTQTINNEEWYVFSAKKDDISFNYYVCTTKDENGNIRMYNDLDNAGPNETPTPGADPSDDPNGDTGDDYNQT